ncbi:MAG: hypothetical protein IM516_04145 [Pseudanabaena sp. M158S2SP1A06QC]|jgi:hypothetical protein|uniref:hypothetical protein n=1 Tax=Pseudanabaena mucicola TaxID=71190 RepID=UPI0025761B3A|nr:hypothetical protein [Pseudanabaena mucicola]MCA6588399.1 hypothetical protein [Pseudanabaena sp. M109S1SP1A06QC]MCA6594617.1 hypothetical protein [Pseudanabaena sp. M38BS1SP1A06MG]MCA6602923.1 hypothetical protein [Pseudanabaena sp. M007S1SP1A06QC]MCA6611303.1 hypothetical protein [Pseudanabaena sp. M158S2SP1A06QC]MCA6614717.1 hypothetical protein [Pseudanabaena sp. M090S1SP1A06QC]MCA6623620.1 hypothetical protein [Pseudanabaena sp. M165S2SP1A06QC]
MQMGITLRKAIANGTIGLGLTLVVPAASYAFTFQFDYTYDTNSFFTNNQAARDRLADAASYYNSFTDNLTSICVPSCGGTNTWTPSFFNPATGIVINGSTDQPISANTLLIYVGGQDLGSSTLGVGGFGGYSAGGTTAFINTLKSRGQSGVLATTPTDYAPWGGSISFTTNASVVWNFGDVSAPPTIGQSDFLSVAIHELGHIMGIISGNPSWDNKISSGSFTGTNSVALYGSNIPLSSGNSHWADGTMSTLPVTNTTQETSMDPTLTQGTRKLLTKLDYAGFKDIGWEVPDNLTSIPFEFKPDMAIAMLATCVVGNKIWRLVRKSSK